MPKFIEYTSEAEWLELRSQDISSTESAALFDLSPYVTKFELYHNKQGQAKSFEPSERMRWGNRLESAIAHGVAEDYGLTVEPFKVYCRHSDTLRMGSSFDFMITGIAQYDMDSNNNPMPNKYQQAFLDHGTGILEIKNVDSLVYRNNWTEEEAPDHIEVQVQHQMEVAGMTWTMICPLVGGNEAKPILRQYDPDIGKALCEAVTVFWADVEAGKEPQPNFARDAEFVIALHQNAGGDTLDVSGNEHIISLLKEYDLQGKIEKEVDARRKAIKAEVLDLVGDASKLIAPGISLALSMTAESPPTVITPEMVGQTYGGRKGFRNFRLTIKEGK